MQPQPPQHGPTTHPERVPLPGPVRGLAAVLWTSAAISLAVLVLNMTTAPMFGVEPGYAFGASLPHTVIGVLMAVAAYPVTRGRSWARTMAKVVLIIQIVMQSMLLLGGNSVIWALFLFPLAIAGVVLLHRPVSRWFFAFHAQAAGQGPAQQYTHHPHHQMNQGYYPPQQYPQQQYPQQSYEQQPPQSGPWDQNPRQQ